MSGFLASHITYSIYAIVFAVTPPSLFSSLDTFLFANNFT